MKLLPFDIEKAKAGAKVVTRDGRSVRILCFDLKRRYQPIVAAVTRANGSEFPASFSPDGAYGESVDKIEFDLFLVDETQYPTLAGVEYTIAADGAVEFANCTKATADEAKAFAEAWNKTQKPERPKYFQNL
jgi:hypothetical protein